MSPFLFVHGRVHISQNAGPAPQPSMRIAKLARRASPGGRTLFSP